MHKIGRHRLCELIQREKKKEKKKGSTLRVEHAEVVRNLDVYVCGQYLKDAS